MSKQENHRILRGRCGSRIFRHLSLGLTLPVLSVFTAAMPLIVIDSANAGGIVAQPASGEPLLGLTPDQLDRFFIGKESFTRVFTAEEGLGPIFNQDSCASCHNNPVGGTGTTTVTRAGFIDKQGNFDPLTELGGSLFQQESITEDCAEVVPEEANSVTLRASNGMMDCCWD